MSTVVGLFDRYSDAERAVNTLEQYGVDRNMISLVKRDGENHDGDAMDAGKGAAAGAATGGVLGLLAGLSAIVIPGIGPVIATGAIASALGSAAIGAGIGAAAGGLLGALVDSGFSREDASFYAEGVKRGGVLVAVKANAGQEERVKDILNSAGAIDMDTRRQSWRDEGWTEFVETEYKDSEKYPTNRL